MYDFISKFFVLNKCPEIVFWKADIFADKKMQNVPKKMWNDQFVYLYDVVMKIFLVIELIFEIMELWHV
jgi:hypothetical protein